MNEQTTAGLVQETIEQNPFLRDFLSRDLINYNSLARELLPEIKTKNPKATIESIRVAIARYDQTNKDRSLISKQLKEVCSNLQIIVKTDVILCSVKSNSEIPEINKFTPDQTFFLNQGTNEITIILDKNKLETIQKKSIISIKENLSAITLKNDSPKKSYREVTGFVYYFLANIVRAGINIEDMISTKSQFTFIVDQKDMSQTMNICLMTKENAK